MGDLFVLLKKRKALTEKHVREVVMQLVTAVVGLHRNNICHRDIKPENVLLERSGTDSPGLIFKVMMVLFLRSLNVRLWGLFENVCIFCRRMGLDAVLQYQYSSYLQK